MVFSEDAGINVGEKNSI